jgi:putative ABC transport system permease protein
MNWPQDVQAAFERRQKSVDASVIEELAQHAAAAFEAARAEGASVSGAEASVRALIESWCDGTAGPTRLAPLSTLHDQSGRGRAWLPGLLMDARLALRLLRRQPGFAAISVAMIALALAAATTIFSIVNGVLLKPLPQVSTEGLFRVFEERWEDSEGQPAMSNVLYYQWLEQHDTIAGLGVWEDEPLSHEGPDGPELVPAAKVTASLFPLIGVSPFLGVNFTSENELADDAVMLSYGFWTERFGGQRDAIGQRLTLGGKPRTIVGVMPRGFEFPDREARVWLPNRVPPMIERIDDRGKHGMSVSIAFSSHHGLARLKPGVTPEQAMAEAAARRMAWFRDFNRKFKAMEDARAIKVTLVPMLDWMVKDVKPALWILSAAVILLFVAAIGNVANMQLARATLRQKEVAIRTAVGAGAGRLLRQLLVETSMLSFVGGAIGLTLTAGLLRVLPALIPPDFPRLDDIAIDGRVLGVAAGLSLAVTLVLGLMPARVARRVKVSSALVEDGPTSAAQSLRSPAARSRWLVITGQVAIAALLLIVAGLLGQSLLKLIAIDRGYRPENLLTARIAHFGTRLPAGARGAFYDELVERLTAAPGVKHVALSDELPIANYGRKIAGKSQTAPGDLMEGNLYIVSRDYFAAMGMRVVRGRGFTPQDVRTSDPVIVVNETFARRNLAGEPLHARLMLELDSDRRGCAPTKEIKSACLTPWFVAGIVADVKLADGTVQPQVFASRSQLHSTLPPIQYLTVRTTGDPTALAGLLRHTVRTSGTTAAIEQIMTMDARLMRSLARPRLYAVLLGGFAVCAVLIAGIGLFGGLSYSVTQRTREIGVRTALGATPRDIVGLIVKQGSVMTLAGLVLGLGAAAATVRYLATFLFGVTPLDVRTFVGVAIALLVIAMAACAIPARRAARIDAINALRH